MSSAFGILHEIGHVRKLVRGSHGESVFKLQRQLSPRRMPADGWIWPLYRHVAQDQTVEFGRRLVTREMPTAAHRLPKLTV
jgi:hypothetical protein